MGDIKVEVIPLPGKLVDADLCARLARHIRWTLEKQERESAAAAETYEAFVRETANKMIAMLEADEDDDANRGDATQRTKL